VRLVPPRLRHGPVRGHVGPGARGDHVPRELPEGGRPPVRVRQARVVRVRPSTP
jgi:hypothetical protein